MLKRARTSMKEHLMIVSTCPSPSQIDKIMAIARKISERFRLSLVKQNKNFNRLRANIEISKTNAPASNPRQLQVANLAELQAAVKTGVLQKSQMASILLFI